eukprot:c19593_g1_i2 orf=2299-2631(-)
MPIKQGTGRRECQAWPLAQKGPSRTTPLAPAGGKLVGAAPKPIISMLPYSYHVNKQPSLATSNNPVPPLLQSLPSEACKSSSTSKDTQTEDTEEPLTKISISWGVNPPIH